MKCVRLEVENKRDVSMLIFVEPEAMDYWLRPGEACEVVAPAEDEGAHFEIQHTDEGMTIFPSRGCGSISVFQRGAELKCGHQRPAGYYDEKKA
jgi:hypothetical protein